MKLLIKESCVVSGGKIKERGQIHDTGDIEPAADREAYALISSGRAVKHDDPEAKVIADQVAGEKAAAAAKKAKEDADSKKK